MRKLRYHEKKLLKKVDFINWELDANAEELKIMRRYGVQKREDYLVYKKMARQVREIVEKLKALDENDKFRVFSTVQLVEKLYYAGIIPTNRNFAEVMRVTGVAFCRRRLPLIMIKLRMSQHLPMAIKFIEHGHVRVGPNVIRDPAYFVTRQMEDLVTWVDSSKIKAHIKSYNEEFDDYDFV